MTSEAEISLSQLWNCLGQNAAPWGRVGIGVTRTLVGGDPYLPTRHTMLKILQFLDIFFSFGFRLHRTVSCSEFYLLNAYLKFMTYHIRIGFWNHNPVFLIPFVRFGISAQMTSKVMKTLKYGGNINCWHIAVKLLLLLLLGPKFWAKPIWIFASLAYVYLT